MGSLCFTLLQPKQPDALINDPQNRVGSRVVAVRGRSPQGCLQGVETVEIGLAEVIDGIDFSLSQRLVYRLGELTPGG